MHNLDILEKTLQEVENISCDGQVSFVSRNEKTERLGDRIDAAKPRDEAIEHFKEFFYVRKGEFHKNDLIISFNIYYYASDFN